mgnify:CR=1 FL=1
MVSDGFHSALRRLSPFIMEDSAVSDRWWMWCWGCALERIGGHAKNTSRYVVFLVKGKDARHKDLETVAAEITSTLK